MSCKFISMASVMMLMSVVLTKPSFAQYRNKGKEQSFALFEVSPLRSALGSPEVRIEGSKGHYGVGFVWNQQYRSSERGDFKDRSQAFRIEGIWYPLGMSSIPVFASAGLQHEDALIGRQNERTLTVWARTSPDETYDRWINKDSYLSLTQSIGYRYVSDDLVTAALSVQRDELISQQSRNQDADNIYNQSIDLSSKGRRRLRTSVMMQVGLYLR